MSHQLKEQIKSRRVLFGTMVTLGSTTVTEILSRVGYDWLWIEMEHAPNELSKVQEMIQATAGRIPCLVRAPWNDAVWIKRILDLGCDGIIIPLIRSAEEARAAVLACKYPPEGIRGVGVGRAQSYGMDFQDYITHANDRLCIVLQAEHIDAATNIESILDVPGIDAILIGPYDLSASMGLTGQIDHPEVRAAIAKIKAACSARQMPLGVFVLDTESAKAHLETGVTLVGVGVDVVYLWKSAMLALDELRSASAEGSGQGS